MADDFDEKTKALQELAATLGEKEDLTGADLQEMFDQITDNLQHIAEAAMVKKIEANGDAPNLNEQIAPFQEIITLTEKLRSDIQKSMMDEEDIDINIDDETEQSETDLGIDPETLSELTTLVEKLGDADT